jgi:hypothetical protein
LSGVRSSCSHIGEELRFVLARLLKLAALILDFVKEPHILDSDARLVGEGRRQFDLLFGKRPHCNPHQHDDAYWIAFAQDGHTHDRTETDLPLYIEERIIRIGQHIRNLNRSPFGNRAAQNTAPSRGERNISQLQFR